MIPPPVSTERRGWNILNWYCHQTLHIIKSSLDSKDPRVFLPLKNHIYLVKDGSEESMKRHFTIIIRKEADQSKRNTLLVVWKSVSNTFGIANMPVKKKSWKDAETRIQWYISESHILKLPSSTHGIFCWTGTVVYVNCLICR